MPGDAVPNTGKATAHVDTFAREHLPRVEMWPVMTASALSDLDYPDRLNAAVELLDRKVEQGLGRRPCLRIGGTGRARSSSKLRLPPHADW